MATDTLSADTGGPTRRPEVFKGHLREVAIVLGVVLSGVILWALWTWLAGSEARAIRDLPAAERRTLYDRTLRTLEGPCARNVAEGLETFCHEQAQFIVQFPECRSECRSVATAHLNVPSR